VQLLHVLRYSSLTGGVGVCLGRMCICLQGIAALQECLSPEEQAAEFEKTGRWTDAHAFYEQALQKSPTCIKSRLGLLNCLKNLGYLETTLSLAPASRSGLWFYVCLCFCTDA
jgi:hypothetical protein